MATIKKPSQIAPKQGMSVLIYGQTGVGKTTFALSSNNALLVDFDEGVNRIAPAHRTDTATVTRWCDVTGLAEVFGQYGAIVIDTYSKFLDCITDFVIEQPKMSIISRIPQKDENGNTVGFIESKKPSIAGYGIHKTLRQDFVKSIVRTGRNFIAVAQEVETIDEKTGKPTKRPACGSGKNTTELLQDLDAVGYMYTSEEGIVIDFTPNVAYYTKCAQLGKLIVRRVLDANGNMIAENNQMQTDIFNRWRDIQAQASQVAAEYEELLAEIRGICETIKDGKTAAKASEKIQTLPAMWDSKLQARRMFAAALQNAGLKWDGNAFVSANTENLTSATSNGESGTSEPTAKENAAKSKNA